MDKNFGGVIWTNHALQKLRERGIKQGDAWSVWRRPEQSRKGKDGSWVYYRTFGDQKVEVVAKQNEKKVGDPDGKWLILSVWSKSVFGKKPESFLSFLFRNIFRK